ncbi:zinc finger protein 516-like isoform X2 [Myripristis murdjan]|uniref:zinc finger protein 516-like isoform X2 n=1 Tax=Myripristis murdjan TaxID=586833 RepID=UPI00117628E5|nr:zinc finger protein 516-like isoform X2 [Myripristis murdjan]
METEQTEGASQKSTAIIKAETEEDVTSGHTCGVCGRSFPLLSSLSQHMRRHTREKPYKCPYCDHRTAQKGSLKVHIRSHKLGLLSHNLGDNEVDGDQGQKDNAKMLDGSPESISTSVRVHNVNGKMKKKGPKKKVKCKDEIAAVEETSSSKNSISAQMDERAEAGPFSCSLCSQVFPQVLLLKAHMKKHRGSQDHGCRICGRRFRQAWFLQSHMRIHRVKAQLRGGKHIELPATINGVPQDPVSLINEECLYELCAGCGNFFYDRKTLRIHEKVHKHNHSHTQTQNQLEEPEDSEVHDAKRHFLESLNLTCVGLGETLDEKIQGKRIPELDPVCSYQAWQLATRGRLVEAAEKCLGWEERLADAEVAYDKEKGEYVPLKQEKKRKQIETSTSSTKKKKSDKNHDHTSNNSAHAKGGNTGILNHQTERVLLNGLGHAFYGALQKKKAKEVCYSAKQTNSIWIQDQEDKKTYFCEHCDFHTVDASLLRSHLQRQHLDFKSPYSKQSTILDSPSQSGPKASRYMDYLRNRSALLNQPYWNPYTCPPGRAWAESGIKTEKSKSTQVKGQGDATIDAASLLNLSALPVGEGDGTMNYSVKKEGLVRHQCPYCSHTTSYPEVLWIHQRVAHRVDGNSSLAPKWAPCTNSFKSSKTGATQWRRTGPPPFLESKDCPALPTPRTQRTQPPGFTVHSSSSKRSAPKTHSGIPTNKPKPNTQSKDSQSADGTPSSGRTGLVPQKKSEQNRAMEGGSKGTSVQVTSSSSSEHSKSVPGFQSTSSPKYKSHRGAVEGNPLPQEGLGFMLARNHGRASSSAPADRLHPPRQTCDSSAGLKGLDLWSAMNLWGVHSGKAYLEPLLFAQGKSESTGEMPIDIDILSLLKNYNPHDLAALYQHWGFVDPRLDPQVLQLNGNFGSEVHPSSEASKQVNNSSTSSSGSLQKGT